MTTPEMLVQPAFENMDETNKELQLIQRNYRRLQDYIVHEETKVKCQKQVKIMKSLEKDKFEIITSLNVASSRAHVENEADVRKTVKERVELTNRLDKDIRMAELNVKELNDHIFQGQKQVMVLIKQVDSDYTSTKRALHTLKSINCLESRLSVNIEKCSITLRDNARLRKQILNSIKERCLFNKMYTYLIARLDAGKKVVTDMIEQTTMVYDQREECQGRMLLLKKNSKHNLFTHSSEMQSLHRSVDHEMCLQEFLRTKGTKRIMETVMACRRLKRIQKLNEVKRSISNYKGILRSIKKFTNQTDLTVISNAFKNQEELNFR
uniref:ODAD1 central coiled coil region domain-containing protein n=1 Tax=Timema cristinae TaxID=61476 RepID=A0A7R9HCV4_TIMCR|nr:unnamed protein product [Timema cristinae]